MTAEKTRRKLFKVAKELNLSHQTIIEFLEKKGYTVSGLNTPITNEMHNEILQRFAQEKVKADKLAKRRLEQIKEEQLLEQETLGTADEIDAVQMAETSEVEGKTPKSKTEELDKEKILEETSLELEEQEAKKKSKKATKKVSKKEKVETEEDTLTPAIGKGKGQETELLADHELEEETKTLESEIGIGDIVDHPIAKQFLASEEEKKKKKTEKKKKIIKKIKDESKTAKADLKADAKTELDEEIIPRRIRALEREELDEDKKPKQDEVSSEIKRKRKKDKKQIDFDEDLTDKERRRRKALEMIRKEGRKTKIMRPEMELEEEAVSEVDDRKKRTRKKKEVDQQEVDDTLKKTLASMQETGTGKKKRKKLKTGEGEEISEDENTIAVTEFITAQDLANLMDVPVGDIIKKCLELGQMVTVNQRLDMDKPEDFEPRHPVVTIMGHVDHGKTSLLDYIRNTNVVAGESGGITQHIGAYVVAMENTRHITFLDTPGHEAFTAMRSRGAQVTDIVVLVIAADDRVMPQTEEAIDHARAANVPILIAINKIDKPNADPQAIRKQLADRDILVEDWGGKIQVVDVSAKSGEGIPDLLEKIQLESELLELEANPKKRATGVVIESRLDKGKGPVATVLIQHGVIRVGADFIVGQCYGRVRALLNERNQVVESAGPGYPVQVLGIDGVPEAGDKLIVVQDERQGRDIALRRQQLKREQDFRQIRLITLDEISRQIQEGIVKELSIIVKADVDGSAQALSDSLQKVSHKDVAVKVERRAVGPITESDVMLASASRAIIIGFHVRPTIKAKELAQEESVDIRLYKVIYDAIEDVKKALEGLLEPEEREEVTGTVEIREIFKASRLGTIAGCYVLQGKVIRNSLVRLIRNDVEIYEGKLSSLKRFKEDVREVASGYECGLMIENYNDLKVGDIVEAYELVKEKRTLET
jgi:translation initiation factor IF-2